MTALSAGMTREQAAELLAAHNKDPFHIEHGETGGCYCGLETMDVKAGDTVKAGQKIGTVGTTPCESADDPHLHFAVKKSGKWIDPLTIFE